MQDSSQADNDGFQQEREHKVIIEGDIIAYEDDGGLWEKFEVALGERENLDIGETFGKVLQMHESADIHISSVRHEVEHETVYHDDEE